MIQTQNFKGGSAGAACCTYHSHRVLRDQCGKAVTGMTLSLGTFRRLPKAGMWMSSPVLKATEEGMSFGQVLLDLLPAVENGTVPTGAEHVLM